MTRLLPTVCVLSLFLALAAPAQQPDPVVKLLDAKTTTGAGDSQAPGPTKRVFQAVGSTSAGAGAATVKVQVSLDRANWADLCTFTMTLSTTATTGVCSSDAANRFVRGNVTALSGTGAAVTLYMGR